MKKFPRAKAARDRLTPEKEELNTQPTLESQTTKITRGLTAPFWEIRSGPAGHSTANTVDLEPTSVATVGSGEVRGSPSRNKKRTQKWAEWAQGRMAARTSEGERRRNNRTGAGKESRTPSARF